MKPPRSILSKDFVYRPSHMTDVAATFRRVRIEQHKQRILAQQELRTVTSIGPYIKKGTP